MKLRFKKLLAIVLCMTMVFSSTLSHFANVDLNNNEETSESIEETLDDKLDLFEEETESKEETEESNADEEKEEDEVNSTESTEETSEDAELEEERKESEESEESSEIEESKTSEETDDSVEENVETKEETKVSETSESFDEMNDKVATDSEISVSDEETENAVENDEKVATSSEIDFVDEEVKATPSELLMEDLDPIIIATKSELRLYDGKVGGGFIPLNIKFAEVEEVKNGRKLFRATTLPEKYDSREKTNEDTGLSYISPIRKQNPYGSCWMFSTMAMFEASIRKKGLAKTEEESNLSEAALMYYVYKGLNDVTKEGSEHLDNPGLEGNDYAYYPGDWADRGGNQFMSTITASAYVSTLYENADTSYSRLASFEDEVPNYTLDGKYAFNSNNYVVNNIYYINKANRDLMKKAIMEHGAIGISYFAGQATAAGTGGDDKYMNKPDGKHYYYTGSLGKTKYDNNQQNHAIAIVGWDDNIPNTNFRYKKNGYTAEESPEENGGWICRNSWGTEYADDGYFYMSYEEPSLDSDVYAVDMIPADTYKFNYHYDTTSFASWQPLAGQGTPVSRTRQAAAANIFKVSDQEQTLDAVSVALNSANTHVKVMIYTKDTEMSNPFDGKNKVNETTASFESAGIYTIPLSEKVRLAPNTYYSIIASVYSDTSDLINFWVDATADANDAGGVYYYNEAKSKQSFFNYLKENGTTNYNWVNYSSPEYTSSDGKITYGSNFRIKGLANPVGNIKVTFNPGDGEGIMHPQYVLENEDTVLSKNVFTKTGYKFDKWQGSDGKTYSDMDAINTSSEVTLTATWTPIKYTITYNTNGGTITPTSITKTYDENLTLGTPTAPTGYKFAGWYSNSELTQKYDGTTDLSTEENYNSPIYAKYELITYTITYDLKGVSATKPENITKTYTKNVTLAEPTDVQSGYLFLAWYEDSELTKEYKGDRDLSITDGSTVTIYAKWKQLVIFNANGHGTAPVTREVELGDIILPDILEDGYTFEGWYKESTCNNKAGNAGDTYNITGAITFYAKWTANKYTITYEANGGTVSPTSFEKTYGTNATLAVPTKTGYTFKGWYNNSDLSGSKYEGNTDLSTTNGDNVTIYAKWDVNKYTIKFNVDGHGVANSITKTYGVNINLANPTGIQSGYTFDGWFKEAAFTNAYDGKSDLTDASGAEVTVYARWKARVTYNVNGHGSLSPNYVDVVLNNKTTLPTLANVVGFTSQAKWCLDADCKTQVGNAGSDYKVTEPKTLYAEWKENEWNITLNINGGQYQSYTPPTKRLYSQPVNLPTSTNISKTGYTFDGWYENSSFTGSKVTSIPAKTDDNKEYWLKWKENSYSITYNENGGSYVSGYSKPTSRLYSATTPLPNNTQISRTGYEFNGWYEASDFAGSSISGIGPNVAANKVVYAKWTEKTYTVTYKDYDGTALSSSNWKVGYAAPTSRKYTVSLALPGDGNVIKPNNFFIGWFKEGDASEKIITSIAANTAEDYVLRAKWDAAHTVTFNYMGQGTNSTDTVRNGYKVGEPNKPTAANKKFLGWYRNNDDSKTTLDESDSYAWNFNTQVTESFTLYAKWKDVVTHTVTFNLTSGSHHPQDSAISDKPATQYIVEDEKATAPSMPVSDGYTFKGWFANPELTTGYNFNTQITGPTTIYGKWELIEYKITYNLKKGTWKDSYTAPTSWNWENIVNLPTGANIERNHYAFDGWYKDSNFTEKVQTLTGVTINLTLYAKWTPVGNYKTINFLPNGGAGNMDSQHAFEGEDTILDAFTFTRSGYSFSRWRSDSGAYYNNRANLGEVTADMILYAEWTPNYSGNKSRRQFP